MFDVDNYGCGVWWECWCRGSCTCGPSTAGSTSSRRRSSPGCRSSPSSRQVQPQPGNTAWQIVASTQSSKSLFIVKRPSFWYWRAMFNKWYCWIMLEGWSVLENCSMQTTFHVILYRHLYHTTVLYTKEKETVQDEKFSIVCKVGKKYIQMSHLFYSPLFLEFLRLGGQTMWLPCCSKAWCNVMRTVRWSRPF